MLLPAEVLHVIAAAASGRDPRKILKGVCLIMEGESRAAQAANGIIMMMATWHDPDGQDDNLRYVVPSETWKEIMNAAEGIIDIGRPNTKGLSTAIITSEKLSHKVAFKPVDGDFPRLLNLLSYPFGTREGRPAKYRTTLIDPRLTAKLLTAMVRAGATSVAMSVPDNANDLIVFEATIGTTTFRAVIQPLRSPGESARPLDEDGAIIPIKGEDDPGDGDDDNETPDMFGKGNGDAEGTQ